jgi:hypothetical protein
MAFEKRSKQEEGQDATADRSWQNSINFAS